MTEAITSSQCVRLAFHQHDWGGLLPLRMLASALKFELGSACGRLSLATETPDELGRSKPSGGKRPVTLIWITWPKRAGKATNMDHVRCAPDHWPQAHGYESFWVLGVGLDAIFFLQNDTVANFVVIWQLVFNHDLIRLKRFVSSISSKLCN
jgi:hypothetical protein